MIISAIAAYPQTATHPIRSSPDQGSCPSYVIDVFSPGVHLEGGSAVSVSNGKEPETERRLDKAATSAKSGKANQRCLEGQQAIAFPPNAPLFLEELKVGTLETDEISGAAGLAPLWKAVADTQVPVEVSWRARDLSGSHGLRFLSPEGHFELDFNNDSFGLEPLVPGVSPLSKDGLVLSSLGSHPLVSGGERRVLQESEQEQLIEALGARLEEPACSEDLKPWLEKAHDISRAVRFSPGPLSLGPPMINSPMGNMS